MVLNKKNYFSFVLLSDFEVNCVLIDKLQKFMQWHKAKTHITTSHVVFSKFAVSCTGTRCSLKCFSDKVS